ncbi:MAG: DNA polymerase III subunit alpha, partial [Rickettsiaceae bacterium]|nr:DNA polymerase III subunit alpha [Rickettsiaceae bacterium]
MSDNFVHLRVKSSYSLLSSVLKINAITELAAKHQMPAVALTDSNNLFALLEFSMAANKAKVQPICGVNVNLLYEHEHKSYLAEILLLAKDEGGYENLIKLVSKIYLNNQRQPSEHVTFQDLIEHNAGLIMLSGYENGVIGELIYRGYEDKAKYYANYFKDLFGDRFYFEIMRHGLEKQKIIESRYLKLSLEVDVPLVATNNVLFGSIEDHDKHDTLLCIASGKLKAETNRPTVSNQCYFKSKAEMSKTFADLAAAISNSYYISKRCAVMATTNPPILPSFANQNISEEEALKLKVQAGLKARLENKFKYENILSTQEQNKIIQTYQARLEYELKVICGMKFAGYFLIVADFIEWSKDNKISVGPGRGSVVGSIIAWSLRISDLDPIKFGLLFERFLNPERVSMPDIDIDFCQERRDEVLKYITQKYGANRVAHIITFGSMQAKAVIKDVSRVLGLRYDIANSITELVPFNAVNPVTLSQAIEQVPELRSAYGGKGLFSVELRDYEDPKQINSLIKTVLDNALTLEGLQRHVSMHAAGIVISGENLLKLVPIYRDTNSQNNIIQYSMKYAELVGLVKFDLLGLQTLTLIAKTLELLSHEGINIDISNIALDDKKTYKLLASGETNGVFQFESFGMKDSIKKIKPDAIGDLIALGALYRPGPMDNIPTYVACKHGKQEPDYLHPLLKEVLKETYGVIIYQEQVMEIAKILGGYSLGSADLLRRAMGKKIKSEMEAQEKIFKEGAAAKGVDSDQARDIFASVAKFAGYGFNKSHAAGYAFI